MKMHENLLYLKDADKLETGSDNSIKKAISKLTLSISSFIFFSMVISIFHPASLNAQLVSPFQTGHYSPAFANVRDLSKMAPGLVIISYNYYGWGNQFADRNGKKYSALQLQDIDPDLPDASVNVDVFSFATIPSFFWGSLFTLLGGANYVIGISPSYYWADAIFVAKSGIDIIDDLYTKNKKVKLSGWGDLNVIPFGLSWGWTHFDATFYYGFTSPTGRYDATANDNIGLGFWSHAFQGFGYWYPNESQATAFMLGLTYELNTNIKGEDLNPGDRLSLEWGFSQYLSERFEIGVMGGHNWQIADDKGEDVYWDASYHDRKSTIAFNMGVWAVKNRFYIAGKYMFDFGARQRFLTQGAMLNLIFVTNAMDGSRESEK